jgi:peptidoglycan/LPS O-acetylase OafA/YrhL
LPTETTFNLIRFIAASAVLVDHCFALVAPEKGAAAPVNFEALEIWRYAVDVFFIVSGFLVTRSVLTQPTLVSYATAQCFVCFRR